MLGIKGAKIDGLKSVYSHVHALGQCRKIIRKLNLVAHISGDTAGSAKEIAEWRDPAKAALAPALAAKIYGLDILAADVEDEKHNTTRFVILARAPHWPERGSVPTVTTFIFRVRNVPAALYKALGGFATNGVNMTKLESYMVDGEFTATQFLADRRRPPRRSRPCLGLRGAGFLLQGTQNFGRLRTAPFRTESVAAIVK